MPPPANNHSPRGLIFDCDGTLADTMPLHWRAWQTIAARYRIHLPRDRFYSLGGVPSRDILKLLSAEQGLGLDHLAVAREKEAEYLPLIAQVEPINAVMAIARENYGRVPLAIASGGTPSSIGQVLAHLGVRHLFQAVVTSEDVARQKPAPDIFLEAARRIGVPPQSLPRLRRHRVGPASDSGGGHAGGGCENAARQDVMRGACSV